jgi:hypothetical protein
LRDLLSKTSKMHRDYEPLEKALESIIEVATFVNVTLKEQKEEQNLIEMSKKVKLLPFVRKKK